MAISYGTYTITEVQEGSQIWTSSAAPTTPNYTFDVSKLVGDSETSIKSGDIIMHSYNRYTVLSVSSNGKTVLAGNLQSIRGATGAASVTYAIIVSNLAIVKDKNGNLSPSTITVTAKSQTGSNAMANYTGRIKIETTTNNSTWTSRINEDAATKTYTIPSDTVAIRCSLYLKGGTTTLLDQQTIPVVSDGTDGINGTNGKDGVDGKDAYSIVLTNENHTFAGNTVSAIASEIECNVIAYKGTTQIAATIGTITGQPTGMTTSLLNNGKTNASFKVKVTTSMTTKNGVLNIPITVDGKSFTKEFTYTLTLDGEKGDKGDRGTNGASQNLLLDAYAPSLTKVDAPWNRYLSDASNTTITGQFIAEDNLPDPNATHFYRITDSSASTKGRGLCFYSSGTPPFINGHTYRIGCWVRKHAGSPKMNITLGSYGSWMPTQRKIENTEWEWFEVVHTFGETDASKTTQSDTYKKLYFYFYNNNVTGSSLDMCGFKMEEVQVNSGTARNFILGTEKLVDWTTTQSATISNGVVTFPDVTADTWREACSAKSFKYGLIRNQYVIFSIKVKADSDKKCRFYLNVSVDNDETTHIRQKYFDQYIYFTGDGEWQTVCLAVPVFDYMFNTGSGTVDFDDCWVAIRFGAANNYWNGFQAKEPQLCLGTTATSWSRAPEDVDEAIDNIEIGGRNLLKGSDVTNTSLTTPLLGGTSTQVIPSGTVITLSVQVDADDVVWASSGNRRIGVASSIVKDGGGNQYIEAWAAMTGRTGTGIDKTFDTSFHGRVKSTYTLQGELPLDKAFNLYVQSVTSGTVSVSRPKLEIGNKATDWTPAPEDVNADIEDARKVATNYLSMDSTGIMVADMNDGEQKPSTATGNNVFIDNTSVNIRDGQTALASFGVDGMQIGLNEESHVNQDYHSWQMVDKDGNTYAYISDLRDKTGTATITEINASLEYQYGEYYFAPAYPADSVISITINNNQVSSFEIKSAGKYIKTVPSPTTSDNTIITYTSSSSLLKAYTLGNRKENSVTGAFSFVEGYNNVGSGRYSHAEGFDNESSAIGSHSEGHGNIASGNNSHVEGGGNVASNSCAHAEGLDCVASGFVSHAEGSDTIASGSYAHSEGFNSRAKGTASHAEGYSDANEDGSHAEGQSTANAWYSHAEGSGTANGEFSHAEGSGTANGELSHAEGTSTASGVLAHAQNQGTKASSRAQTAIGKYNIEDTANTYAFIIGNGTYDSTRSNALTVDWNGTIKTADGFDSSKPPFKWKSASYTASNLASGYTDVTTNVTFPTLSGYSRTIMVVGTNSAYTGATGAYIDSNNKVHIRCRNFNTATSSPTISFIMIYLNNAYTW